MAKTTSRLAGQLVGGLLVGALGVIVWATRRKHSISAELTPSPATPPPTPVEPSDAPAAQPATRPTTARPGARAFLVAAAGIGIAIAIAGAVALTPVLAGAGAWQLPLAIAGGVLLLAGAVFVLPPLLAPQQDLSGVQGLSAKDRIQFADDSRKLQNDVRASLLQAIAGGAVLIGVLFTWQQQQATSRQIADQLAVTRQGQVGERFSRAVGQLGSNSIDVRLGGLYELEQLARQAPERRRVIIEVVAAYIRQHARPPANMPGRLGAPLPQDVAAAFTIVSRRSIEVSDPRIDLRKAELDYLDLRGTTLRSADLTEAHLRGADLMENDLKGAVLIGADMVGADLFGADLVSAEMTAAQLTGAILYRADLGGAHLFGARLAGARLIEANLVGADLQSADLTGADLTRASLTNAKLRGAKANRATLWPGGFDWDLAGVEMEQ